MTGQGNDIVFTVNGQALPSIGVEPPTTGPLPDTPLMRYGSQVAGQNQIVWSIGVNLDNIVDAYANYAVGGSDPSPQQRNLLLTDDLQGGQAITSGGVTVYMPVWPPPTRARRRPSSTRPSHHRPVRADRQVGGRRHDAGRVREQRAHGSRATIGVWENRVVYIGFGNVPTGNGSSPLNIGNILDGQGEAGLSWLLEEKGATPAQKAIIMKYFSASGPNKGDFTSFIVELRSDASETGQYENNATLTYGDSGSEAAPGSAHFTVISGGVEVKDGKAVLKKVDAGNPDATLPGAVFKLEEQAADGSWVEVPGYESLVTDGSGLIEVERLAMGAYRFVEVSAPEGYELETAPVEFTLAEDAPGLEVAVTATNTKSPVFGKAVLKKVDAEAPDAVLPGATFKLEQRLADDSWEIVPGHDALVTDAGGLIEVADLAVGSYRFVETAAPEGYVLDDTPREFAIDAAAPAPIVVNLTAANAKEPPAPLGKVVLTKVDADSPTTVLPGACSSWRRRRPTEAGRSCRAPRA